MSQNVRVRERESVSAHRNSWSPAQACCAVDVAGALTLPKGSVQLSHRHQQVRPQTEGIEISDGRGRLRGQISTRFRSVVSRKCHLVSGFSHPCTHKLLASPPAKQSAVAVANTAKQYVIWDACLRRFQKVDL